MNQQVNYSEVTAEHLNHVTPRKIGVAGSKYEVELTRKIFCWLNFDIPIIIK
jgi:hypothetical protein